ncbi:hypothetical protein BDV93DRAFT_172137 [Ceratobasidium sp. AG-I]|nr:hypothetical protein BDV93DRAFT_172137 [Ceratobasidium sp. AG-I]
MSAKERTAYRKLLKLPLKGVREGDRAVVSGALSRFESLVLTHDPFPSDDNFRRLAGHANVWSCKKSAQVNLQMLPNSPYEDLMYSRIPNMRSAIVKNAAHETPMAYGFKPVNNENIQFNQDLATRLLDSAMFTCISFEEPGSFYENPVFVQIIRRSWFATASGCGPSHKDLWEYITIPCLALIATGVERVLMKYQRGDSDKLKFTTVDFKPKYVSHVVTLVEMFKLDGPRLEDHCRQMAIDIMKPFKAIAIPVRLIAPRIPLHLITSHYKRSGLSQEQPKPPAARRAPPSSFDAGASGWSSSSNTHTRASKSAPQRPEVPKAGYTSDGMDEPELWREGMEEGLPPTRFAQLLKQIGSDSDEEVAKPIAKAPPPRTKEEAIAMALKEWEASQRTSTSTPSAEVSAAGASGISGLRRRPIVAKDTKEEEEPSEDEGEMDVQEKAADDDSRRGAEAMDVDDDDDESDGEGRSGGAVKQVAEDVAMSDVGSVGTGESWDGE